MSCNHKKVLLEDLPFKNIYSENYRDSINIVLDKNKIQIVEHTEDHDNYEQESKYYEEFAINFCPICGEDLRKNEK